MTINDDSQKCNTSEAAPTNPPRKHFSPASDRYLSSLPPQYKPWSQQFWPSRSRSAYHSRRSSVPHLFDSSFVALSVEKNWSMLKPMGKQIVRCHSQKVLKWNPAVCGQLCCFSLFHLGLAGQREQHLLILQQRHQLMFLIYLHRI